MKEEGVISSEAMAALEARIGKVIEHPPQPHIEEASKDTIRHFAWGMGDDNPLWLDENYAAKGPEGELLAPPCILYAMDRIVSGYVGGLPGVHALFAGTDWTWYRPLRRGDQISARSQLKSVELKQSRFSKQAVKQTYLVEFLDQAGAKVAEADSWCFRTERHTARKVRKYGDITPDHRYSEAEIERIVNAYAGYRRRGAAPLYWDDVEEGQSLPTLPKGPLTVTGMIAWDQGWGGLYIRAHKLAYDMFEVHPALAIPNAQGVPDVPERVHWEDAMARSIGAPGPYDYGPERVAWLSQLMTDFIGDHGFLRRLYAEVRRFNVVGDLTECSGKVARKYVDGDDHMIECCLTAVNQRGETNAFGTGYAVLPKR